MEVWISSAVRSRNPVLMKKSRSRVARIIWRRLSVVRRSSSITCRGGQGGGRCHGWGSRVRGVTVAGRGKEGESAGGGRRDGHRDSMA